MFKPEEVDAAKLLEVRSWVGDAPRGMFLRKALVPEVCAAHVEVKRTAWIEDEWACGAYSFVAAPWLMRLQGLLQGR